MNDIQKRALSPNSYKPPFVVRYDGGSGQCFYVVDGRGYRVSADKPYSCDAEELAKILTAGHAALSSPPNVGEGELVAALARLDEAREGWEAGERIDGDEAVCVLRLGTVRPIEQAARAYLSTPPPDRVKVLEKKWVGPLVIQEGRDWANEPVAQPHDSRALRIGQKVFVNADMLPASYREDWRNVEAFVAGLRFAKEMPGGIDVTITEVWPPNSNGDLTDGFEVASLIGLEDPSHAG